MGLNYGHRRARGEILRGDKIVGYAIGQHNDRWSHIDEQVIADIVNERLDEREEAFRRNV